MADAENRIVLVAVVTLQQMCQTGPPCIAVVELGGG